MIMQKAMRFTANSARKRIFGSTGSLICAIASFAAALILCAALGMLAPAQAHAVDAYGSLPNACDVTPVQSTPNDLMSYVGWWCNEGIEDDLVVTEGPIDELHISGVIGDNLVLTILRSDGSASAGTSSILAPVSGGIATFAFTDSTGTAYQGTLTLQENSIAISTSKVGTYQISSGSVNEQYQPPSFVMNETLVRDSHYSVRVDLQNSYSSAGLGIFSYSGSEVVSKVTAAYSNPLVAELGINEIFARYGYAFSTDYIAEYFDAQPWYVAQYSAENCASTFDYGQISSVEQQSINNIREVQNAFATASSGCSFYGTSGTYTNQTSSGEQPSVGSATSEGSYPAVTLAFDSNGAPTITIDPGNGEAQSFSGVYLSDNEILAYLGTNADGSDSYLLATWYSPAQVTFSVLGPIAPGITDGLIGEYFVNDSFRYLLDGTADGDNWY